MTIINARGHKAFKSLMKPLDNSCHIFWLSLFIFVPTCAHLMIFSCMFIIIKTLNRRFVVF